MKSRILCASLLICCAAFARQEAPTPVDVYMQSNNALWAFIWPAKALVSEIFAGIGVSLTWHEALSPLDRKGVHNDTGRPAFTIRWLERVPASASGIALAAAHPFNHSGPEVAIYEDRLQQYLKQHPDVQNVALAYILAHELAHVMQGIDRHSNSGILKAEWSRSDRFQMVFHKLAFTPEDVDLIHCGLDARASGWAQASGTGTL
jgi:hypothetical protein